LVNKSESNLLRASEIGNYAYCARSWWLSRVRGLPSAHLERMMVGEEKHRSHGRAVVASNRLERLAYLLLLVGGMLALAAGWWWVVAGSAR
jgi:hypothetical protein